jgi:adenine-specific DNA-methyltransferase
VRYLGNKTKLLPAIEGLLQEKGIAPPGVFFDVFSGSGAVARRMKQLGWRVVANDHLACAATQARAAIELDEPPTFEFALRRPDVRSFVHSTAGEAAIAAVAGDPDAWELRAVIAFLNQVPGVEGLIFRQYSAGGPAGRRFFTEEVGRRIDGVRATLARWRAEGALRASEEPVLLAALLDAADRSANISGTYGAFLKTWQANAKGPLVLRAPSIVPGEGSKVFCRDSNLLVDDVPCSVLYIDPPYNRRQYAKNYHVLEVLAELATVEDETSYEAGIYGTSGLREFADRKSAYCMGSVRGRTSPCEVAFTELLANARAEHIVISYSEEGILSRETLGRVLAQTCPGFTMSRGLVEVSYKRFRSDRDEGARRRYRVLANRKKDEVREWLIYAHKKPARSRARGAGQALTPRSGS